MLEKREHYNSFRRIIQIKQTVNAFISIMLTNNARKESNNGFRRIMQVIKLMLL